MEGVILLALSPPRWHMSLVLLTVIMVVIKINMEGVFEGWFSDLDALASLKACETGIYFNAQQKTLSFDV